MTEKATLIVHSGDLDKMYSALIIGNGALAMGMDVSMYFTFWGLMRLKRNGLARGGLSRMNMLGLGRIMIRRKMAKGGVASLDQLMTDYRELGGRIIACDMTMNVMGIRKDELDEELIDEYGAVGTYIKEARDSKITLFI